MKLKALILTTALAMPAMAFAAPTPPTCPTTPGLVYTATTRCLNFVSGTNIGDQRDCFDALQAADTLEHCTMATLTFLVQNPNVVPPSKGGGTQGPLN